MARKVVGGLIQCSNALNDENASVKEIADAALQKHIPMIEEAAAKENASIPLGRPAEPGEIADAIAYLASPGASYITGVVLPVAGGMAPGI